MPNFVVPPQLLDPALLCVMPTPAVLLCLFGEMHSELLMTFKQGNRHRPVTLGISAFGFDMPFFVPAVRISEYGLEPVMRTESPEHVRQLSLSLFFDMYDGSGQIVEPDTLRYATHLLKNLFHRFQKAFLVLRRYRIHERRITIRERQHKQFVRDELMIPAHFDRGEVRLRFSRRMFQPFVSLGPISAFRRLT
jgi:hypothetical protein